MKCYMAKVPFLAWIVLILFCSQSVNGERWDGNTLYDLEGSGATFLAQANLWTISTLKNPSVRVYNCNGADLLGGFNILADTKQKGGYYERNYANLPSHNQISFYMDFYPLDSWDSAAGDHFKIQFDNNIIEGWTIQIWASPWSRAICGSTAFLDISNIRSYIVVPHNSSSLTFRLISWFDQASFDESFGFRNISFTFENVSNSTNNYCGSTSFPLPNNWCPCPLTSQYMNPTQSGTCFPCNGTCLTCTGPNKCTLCADGSYLSGGGCLPCNSACATCTGGASNQCKSCHAGEYLVGNNTCVSVCPAPFYNTTNTVIDFCETHCPSKYAFQNGLCQNNCPAPFQTYTLATLKACVCNSSALDDDACMACDISCATCNGTTAVDCFTCFDGFYLDNGASSQNGTCEPCDPSCATCYGGAPNQCNSCFSNAFLVRDGSVNNGTCGNCNSSCVTCDGPTDTNCLSCPGGFYLDQNPSPAVDGVCLACNSTCANCTGPASNECLSCYSGDYLVTNNTCISECNNPFFSTSDDANDYCDTPCLGQYAFPDQTCGSTCPNTSLYHVEETAVILKACICLDYIYSNGSCLAICKSPLTIRIQNGAKYCDFNCAPGSYMNYDGICLSSCDLPSIPRVEGDYLFCDYGGCDSVQIKHIKHTPTGHAYELRFIPDTTCHPDTSLVLAALTNNEDFKRLLSDPQFVVTLKNQVYNVQLILAASVLQDLSISLRLIGLEGTMPIPGKFVQSGLTQDLTNIANTAATAMGAITVSNIIASLSLKNTASAWGLVGFQQFITFFKYANIDYPLQLEFFFILGGPTALSKSSNVLAKLTESEYSQIQENDDVMDQQTPPEKFFYYDITSFFIQNGGATFLINWIGLAIVSVIILIKRIPLLKKSKAYKFVEMADDKLRWNFVLRSFLATALPQSIAIFLQLRVLSNQETYLSLSAALTILALLHYIGMCVFIFYILHKTNFEDMKNDEIKKRYSTLIDGMKPNSTYSKYYHVLILLRGILLAIMVVFTEKVALLQVIIMIVFNVGLVYFLFKVEFKERRGTIKTRITESVIILMEICFTLLTRGMEKENYYNTIGWTAFGLIGVMFLNELIFALTSQIIGVIGTLKTVKEKYKDWKKKKAEKVKMTAKVTPIQPEAQEEVLTVEPRSNMMSPNASISPTECNNLLVPRLSLKDSCQSVAKDVTPKGSVGEKVNFGRTIKIPPAPISPMVQDDLSENESFSEERSAISMSLETRDLRETNAFWLKPRTPDCQKRQVSPESATKNIEEVTLLETEKKL